MKASVIGRIKKVKLVIFDVDGVLTDGSINVDHNGNEFKVFNVQDGLGIVLLHKHGIKTAIISARPSKAVIARAADLKIENVYLDAYPKTKAYVDLLTKLNLKDEDVCFVGDDLADLSVLKQVGFAVAVANATAEVKKIAHHVTAKQGGNGAVREVIELIFKTQKKWQDVIKEMS